MVWIQIRVGSVFSNRLDTDPDSVNTNQKHDTNQCRTHYTVIVTKETLTFDSIQLMTLPLSAIGTSSFTSGVLSYPRLLNTCSSLYKDKPFVSDPHWFPCESGSRSNFLPQCESRSGSKERNQCGPMRIRIRILVSCCQKKLDFDMKNTV